MNITREEAAALKAKLARIVVQKEPEDLLAIFVPGPLRNPSNGSYVHWSKHRKWARDWKDRVAQAVLEARWGVERPFARTPKRVAFLANVHTLFDDDNLASALKPVRDGLVDCGVIHGDGPNDGHEFVYAQQVNRQHRGVEIHVRLRGDDIDRAYLTSDYNTGGGSEFGPPASTPGA